MWVVGAGGDGCDGTAGEGYGLAVMPLGYMAVDKFNKTGILEDLGEALRHIAEGIDKLPQSYEGRPTCLSQITILYSS